MADNDTTKPPAGAAVKPKKAPQTRPSTKPKKEPPYNVILLNDDDHSYDYVVLMLGKLFGYDQNKAFEMAWQVDRKGRAIVATTTREKATLMRDQIHAFGKDVRIPRCAGSMTATIEAAEG